MALLCTVLSLYVLVLIATAIFSFFPIGPDSGLFPVVRVLHMLTEPILTPMRRVIPPLGMFDMSFLVLFLGIQIIKSAVLHCPPGIFGL